MYLPRRRTLKAVFDKFQDLEDDKLDELFVHHPPRTGKSLAMTFGNAWHCARHPNSSNLYATYKESLGGSFLDGVIEIYTDPIYPIGDVFPNLKVARTDAKNHKLDLNCKRKYWTLSGKGLESGLNGEYDATGWLTIDDILEGIQDVMNPETLKRKQTVFDNNLMSRKKEKCKIIYNGTIWILHEIFPDRLDFHPNQAGATDVRVDVLKLPALDENDKSNFEYDYSVGFSTKYYIMLRAKFEENDDMASWYAQYQQEPIERDGAVFSPEGMKFYNGVLPAEEPVRICAACDVALGGEDFLSFVVAYIYEDGSCYIDDVVFDNEGKANTQPKVVHMFEKHDIGSAFFEANQGGEGYADDIDRMIKEKYGRKVNIQSKYAQTDKRKEQRIWDKAPAIKEFYFRDTGCRSLEYRKFMQNLYGFTMKGKNKHDDAADCMATLCAFVEGNWHSAKVEAVVNPFRSKRYLPTIR